MDKNKNLSRKIIWILCIIVIGIVLISIIVTYIISERKEMNVTHSHEKPKLYLYNINDSQIYLLVDTIFKSYSETENEYSLIFLNTDKSCSSFQRYTEYGDKYILNSKECQYTIVDNKLEIEIKYQGYKNSNTIDDYELKMSGSFIDNMQALILDDEKYFNETYKSWKEAGYNQIILNPNDGYRVYKPNIGEEVLCDINDDDYNSNSCDQNKINFEDYEIISKNTDENVKN